MLADAAGEDDGVQLPERCVVGADVLPHAVGVDVERERGRRVAGGTSLGELTEVVDAGETEQARLAVEHPVDLVQGPAELAVQMAVDRRVEVTGAGAHHQPLERGEPHRCVDGLPTTDRGRRRPVAEVQHHEVGVLDRTAEQLRGATRDEGVRRAVEAVAPDPVFVAPAQGHGVGVGVLGHRLVEGGVEDRDLRHLGEEPQRDPQSLQVGRVVEGRERDEVLDDVEQAFVDERRLGEEFATVHDAVTHRSQGVAVDRGPVAVEGAEGRAERVLEVRDRALLGVVMTADRVRERPAVLADPLYRPGRLGDAGDAVEKAVLQ